ncbi:ovarian-specific serine/threonine-protein kinase Lok-like [Anopheles albimanus]|uniref:ovarian-specific serine/threonine-protein kinase Lok-like n=1 Tax=Anopheles albimanus TaxID=7167 RepID=UPI001641AA25|nr:ovarian-specific serine/threonine-protein kinase Lok-like [Anopheles albimanus]
MTSSQAVMDTLSDAHIWEEKLMYGLLLSKNVKISTVDLYDGQTRVGRYPSCELCLNTQHMPEHILTCVSRLHFVIEKQENDFDAPVYITDRSQSGTYVNGKLIGTNQQTLLKDRDIISIYHPHLEAFVYQELRTKYRMHQSYRGPTPDLYGVCDLVHLMENHLMIHDP